jgi:hypothetical protein
LRGFSQDESKILRSYNGAISTTLVDWQPDPIPSPSIKKHPQLEAHSRKLHSTKTWPALSIPSMRPTWVAHRTNQKLTRHVNMSNKRSRSPAASTVPCVLNQNNSLSLLFLSHPRQLQHRAPHPQDGGNSNCSQLQRISQPTPKPTGRRTPLPFHSWQWSCATWACMSTVAAGAGAWAELRGSGRPEH